MLKSVETLHATSLQAKILSVTLIAVMLEIILHGLVDVPFFKNDLSVLFMIILAVAVINGYLIKSEKNGK